MLKRLSILCLLILTLPALAENAPPPEGATPAPAEQVIAPDELVRIGLIRLIDLMNQHPKPEDKDVAAFLDAKIAPFFDWHYMARAASGRLYTYRLNDFQRRALAEDMKRRFLTQMTQRLTKWGAHAVTFLPTQFSPEGDMAVLTMQIMEPARLRPAEIQLHIDFAEHGWAIIDIVANGVSAVAWYQDQLLIEARYQNYEKRRQ